MMEDGKMPIGMRETLARIFPTFAGKKIKLSISEAKEKRSLDQNSYYWAAIVPHVRQVRFDMGDPVSLDECHEDLLTEFAPMVWKSKLMGKSYQRPMRSKEMNVEQMANYITAITAKMAEFGNPVPTKDYEQ
jgi:hypothetical protein